MFTEKRILFLYVDTPLHAGSGRGLGAVDLPLQRERVTGYPMVQSTGLKGRLRDAYRTHHKLQDDDEAVTRLFGKAGESGESYAGSIAPGDARLLLFPVRSLAGVFAWTTSIHALSNFRRSAELGGHALGDFPDLHGLEVGKDDAWVCKPGVDGKPTTDLKAGSSVVLEEFSFTPQPNDLVNKIGAWLAKYALPENYSYWLDALPRKLCILHEDAFRDFCKYATEVQTHIRLDPNTKTVSGGALWTEESLPMDTLLYAPVMASGARYKEDDKPGTEVAAEMLGQITGLDLRHLQLGGDETTGQGWVSARWWAGMKEDKKEGAS
ncbi:MAG: type III-B CRISPR module RAMP protein Cmr4 [Chloroflexi bacterium]|nr:type III-B CRISPR module RAMP protein Cmr4 [Chloroflexota bacterium]